MSFWKRAFHPLQPYRGWVIVSALTQMVYIAMTVGASLLFKPTLDAALAGRSAEVQCWLLILFAHVLPVGVLMWVGRWAQTRFVTGAVRDFRNDLAQHVQRLPMSRVERESTGDLMARLNSGASTLAELLDSLPELFGLPISLLGGFIALLYLSWPIALFTLLLALPPIWVSLRMMKPVEALAHERAEREGEATAILQDTLAGVAVVKAYGLKTAMLARLGAVYDKINVLSAAVERKNVMALVPFWLAQYLPQIVLPLTAGALAVGGQLTAGGALAISALYYLVIGPISQAQQWQMRLSFMRPVIQRAFDVFDMPTEADGRTLDTQAAPTAPPLTLNAVHFGYADDRATVLRGVSLQVSTGQTVALVGASGGGKSSVIKLICGFYAPQAGDVQIFGQPLSALSPDSARNVMALVSQDTYLFPGTIAENIGQGRPGASFDAIVTAARAAHADGFIGEQPQGYQTRVGERGVLLSGGQRQRIALARAILKDAPILLLDEPTASLDMESERLIQEALQQFGRNRATLVVAHRLSTIRDADEIVVLEGGAVAERGTHAALMALDGVYRRLVAQQVEATV